jgi:hypothetical protein
MKLKIKAGTTSRLVRVFIQDSTSAAGAGLTGLTSASAGLACYYSRVGDASATAVTLTAGTLGTWSSGGFVAVDGTNMPGVYELGLPNAVLASGSTCVHVILRGAANMVPVLVEIELDAIDYQDSVRGGFTALPNAAAGTNTGLPVVGTQVPNATAGAANGLFINGANTGPSSLSGGLSITNSTGDALTLTSSGSNGSGLNASGNGTGDGIKGTGGVTGHGLHAIGGATSGSGFRAEATTNANGVTFAGAGTGHGIAVIGGATGNGLNAAGGATSGSAFKVAGTAGNAIGVEIVGQGSAAGMSVTGGATGDGFKAVAGTGGADFRANHTGDMVGNITGNLAGNVSGTVSSVATVTNIVSAMWQDLTAGADFSVTGSIGKLLATSTAPTAETIVTTMLATSVPIRNQDAVSAPNLGDALLGAWSKAFAPEKTQSGSTSYQIMQPGSTNTPVRTFTLDVAPSAGPFLRT